MSWISVIDNVPKLGATVLVCQTNKNIFTAVMMGSGAFKMYGTFEDIPSQNPITHWMPLPKPPKK